MANQVEGKDVAVIAHITVVGLIIALVMNSNNKTTFASYHIRQMLGLWITGFIVGVIWIIPILGWIAGAIGYVLLIIMWIVGLINAINGYEKPMPVFGAKYAEWFKSV